MSSACEIVAVESAAQLEEVRRMFQEYWDSFHFTPCFQNFGEELKSLPGDYAPPPVRLGLARVSGECAGCIALRPYDLERCEAKRLYVRPAYRDRGIGRKLMDWVIAEARTIGYRELLGDTMPVMRRALSMYDRMGFERTGPYGARPTEGAVYIRLCLR
jgi:GNAT superfamily N-acetyltransferase